MLDALHEDLVKLFKEQPVQEMKQLNNSESKDISGLNSNGDENIEAKEKTEVMDVEPNTPKTANEPENLTPVKELFEGKYISKV